MQSDTLLSTMEVRQSTSLSASGILAGSEKAVAMQDLSSSAYLMASEEGRIRSTDSSPSCARIFCTEVGDVAPKVRGLPALFDLPKLQMAPTSVPRLHFLKLESPLVWFEASQFLSSTSMVGRTITSQAAVGQPHYATTTSSE